MSAGTSQREDAVLQGLLPKLEAEGFAVFIHPSRDFLPPFLGTTSLDAIAYKGDRKIAIEVMAGSQGDGPKFERIRDLFADHPDWELQLVYAPPSQDEMVVPAVPKTIIEEHLSHIERSFEAMGPTAALLTTWAAFEAAARRLGSANLDRTRTPRDLVEVLASEGYVTPDEADIVRPILKLRNEVAHGRLDLGPGREQVDRLVRVTRILLDQRTETMPRVSPPEPAG